MTVPRTALMALLLAWPIAATAWAMDVPPLTVGVRLHRPSVSLTATRGLAVYDAVAGRRLFSKLKPSALVFSVHPKGFLIAGFGVRSRVRVEPLKDGYLSVDGAPYRGHFIVEEDRFGKISVINVVDVEDYLYGVIKSEMLISSPMEALKAQAVIARTFAIKNRERYTKERGYGLSADVSTQVYSGIQGEAPRATRAVVETRGMVLTFRGKLIDSFYHSACGGWTINNEDAWCGTPKPYLRGIRCGYCADTPNFSWRTQFTYATILEKILESGHRLSHIRAIRPITDSVSGRTMVIVVENDTRELRLLSNQFRLAMGTRVIRSSFFTCVPPPVAATVPDNLTGDTKKQEMQMRTLIGTYLNEVNPPRVLIIEGCGSGHGVGLCQSGARGLAELGKSFKDILLFYYQDVTITGPGGVAGS